MLDEDKLKLEKQYIEIIKFYGEVKELIIAAEKEDIEQRISITAIAELRSAYDHIMRAHSVMYGIKSVGKTNPEEGTNDTVLTPFNYCEKNLGKSYAHLCRAGYDAHDIIALLVFDDIDSRLLKVSKNIVHAVIPDASDKIFIPLNNIREQLTKAKLNKDIEDPSRAKQQYDEYEQANLKLVDIRLYLLQYYDEVVKADTEAKNVYLLPVIIGIIFTFVGILVAKYFL